MMSDENTADGGDTTATAASSSGTFDPSAVPSEGEGSWASFGDNTDGEGGSGGDQNDPKDADKFDQESPPMSTSLPGVDDRDVVERSDTADLEDVPVAGTSVPHGDLPDPDTLPRDPSHVAKIRQRKKRMLLGAAGLIAACVIVVVCVGFFGPGDAAKTAVPGVTGTAESGSSGGGGGDDTPTRLPPVDDEDKDKGEDEDEDEDSSPEDHDTDAARLKDARDYILKNGVSRESDLDDDSAPQHLALEWIATLDTRKIPIPHTFLDNDDTWGVVDHSTGMKFVQRYSLAVLYFSAGGTVEGVHIPNQEVARGWKTPLNMMTGEMECDWNERYKTNGGGLVDLGVLCDDKDVIDGDWMRVTKIWIPWDHKLIGTIPPEIRHLSHLTSISMAYQDIHGTIPSQVCSLSRLEELSLSNNLVTGSLPSCLDEMESLRILALDDNLVTGDLSVANKMLPLEFLYLEDNGFEHTLDDAFFENLDKLIHLDISDNKLAGNIPARLFTHPALRVLDLHDNELTGEVPAGPNEQNTLEFLALHKNQLSGTIPAAMGNLKGLVYLDLAHNKFTGKLSEEVSDGVGTLTGLKYLFLGGNDYDAESMPSFLANMTDLLELSLKDSGLTGPIPNWIGQLKELYLLDLDGNALSGQVPPELGSLTNMLFLLLNRNDLTGQVPPEMAQLINLQVLLLDDNDLSGSLDDSGLCAAVSNTTDIAADCAGTSPEISCDFPGCCNICCEDDGEPCNDDKWIANNDPIWEHRYGRYRFVFEDEAD